MSAAKPFRLTGWHVLGLFVLFFGTDIAINTGFIVYAVKTFPGEVAGEPYEAGIAYNKTLAEQAAEAKLGWAARVETPAPAGRGEAILVRWADKDGRPLTRLTVTGDIKRPATEAQNLNLRFAETEPGLYRAVAPAAPGAWDLSVTAANGQGEKRTAERRLIWR
ncbi:FixH family protein [Phenylobacterium montanum]|uniref:FixH family protein n=1 Tax=Phenylobacterium montanum TaxID=2823693 RepID=A0A975G060_9CAUL|nr:FixH family protein [Caulobacter sp. S6]QUD87536.1 FixH family protein [Caulobacter sp. S6]